MKIGVFGGTFDPVHMGHLVLAEIAREQLQLNQVLWIPAGDPWRKSEHHVSDALDRLEMVRRAVEGNARFEVRDYEVERNGPSYTVETLDRVHADYAGAEAYLLLGRDALDDMQNWKEPNRITAQARLAVACRGDARVSSSKDVTWLDMPDVAISSTDIRRRVRERRTIRYLVPAAVEEYILDRGLYQT